MDKMKKVPDIRFKGYEGEWNETPLCEYLCVSNEKNASCVYNNMTSILFRENMV